VDWKAGSLGGASESLQLLFYALWANKIEGVPVAINGRKMGGYELIQYLNILGGKHGIGRNDMVEDRILGLKARENYEHPAATVLLTAHRDLESLVLSRQELAFKRMVDDKWSELAYGGLVDEPLYSALNSFIDTTQDRVNGTVDLQLFKGNIRILGRSSPYCTLFRRFGVF
jgi:argininosuccinate synthase